MDVYFSPTLFALAWLIGMLIMMEVGRRIGARQLQADKQTAGTDMMGGVVFTLCGLLMAFTLAGGASRYDTRRMLIAQEVNDIGTAYFRVDLLDSSDQPQIRDLFRQYLNSRILVYRKVPDITAAKAQLGRSSEIQLVIWKQSVSATRHPGAHPDAAKLLLPALNNMFDVTSTRLMAARIHPPLVIYYFLFLLGLGCALIIGIRMGNAERRSWLHVILFSIVMSGCAYVIVALEYPRMGVINLHEYDQLFVELADSMK
jgi:hypothetical protein